MTSKQRGGDVPARARLNDLTELEVEALILDPDVGDVTHAVLGLHQDVKVLVVLDHDAHNSIGENALNVGYSLADLERAPTISDLTTLGSPELRAADMHFHVDIERSPLPPPVRNIVS
jgi:hypothetical protein